jgi:hypothetical protein
MKDLAASVWCGIIPAREKQVLRLREHPSDEDVSLGAPVARLSMFRMTEFLCART